MEARTLNKEHTMPEDHSIDSVDVSNGESGDGPTTVTFPDPDYPDIPYPVYRPARGSPYVISPISGRKGILFPPGTPPMTLEDVRRALEDFP